MNIRSKVQEVIITKSDYRDKKTNKKISCVDLFDLKGKLLVHYEDINSNQAPLLIYVLRIYGEEGLIPNAITIYKIPSIIIP